MKKEEFKSAREAERALLQLGLPRLMGLGAAETPPVHYSFHEELRGPELRVNKSLELRLAARAEGAASTWFATGVELVFPERDRHRFPSQLFERKKATGEPDWKLINHRVATYLKALREAEARAAGAEGSLFERWRDEVIQDASLASLTARPGTEPNEVVVDISLGEDVAAEAVVVRLEEERVGLAFDVSLPKKALGLFLTWLDIAVHKTLSALPEDAG